MRDMASQVAGEYLSAVVYPLEKAIKKAGEDIYFMKLDGEFLFWKRLAITVGCSILSSLLVCAWVF